MNCGLVACLSGAPLSTVPAKMVGNDVQLCGRIGGGVMAECIGGRNRAATTGNGISVRTTVTKRRAKNIVDLQTIRTASDTRMATALCSTIMGGFGGTASGGGSSVLGGGSNTCTQTHGVVLGGSSMSQQGSYGLSAGLSNSGAGAYGVGFGGQHQTGAAYGASLGLYASGKRLGTQAHARGCWASAGDCQAAEVIQRWTSAALTQFFMTFDAVSELGTTIATANRFILSASQMIVAVDVFLVYREITTGLSGAFHRRALIERTTGVTALVGSVETIGTDYDEIGGTTVTMLADDTNDALRVAVTPTSANGIRWMALLQHLESHY